MPHLMRIIRPDWLDDEVWPYEIRTYFHEDRTIHYLDEGDGPVLVLVHAGMWSFVWRELIARLRSDYRVLALDYPGAGLTHGSRDDVDLASFADITEGWLDHLGIDEAVFVVHDLGGVVGVNVAARRPERVVGLVAANSFAWPPHRR